MQQTSEILTKKPISFPDSDSADLVTRFNKADAKELPDLLPFRPKLSDADCQRIVSRTIFLLDLNKAGILIKHRFLTPDQEIALLKKACDDNTTDLASLILNNGNIPLDKQAKRLIAAFFKKEEKNLPILLANMSTEALELALNIAANHDQKDFIKYLLKHGRIDKTAQKQFLKYLAIQGKIAPLKCFLMATKKDIDMQEVPLLEFIQQRSRDAVANLFKSGVSKTVQVKMIENAFNKNQVPVMAAFLENGRIDDNIQDFFLRESIIRGHDEMAHLLLRSGTRCKKDTLSGLLLYAAITDNREIADFFMENADPEHISPQMLKDAISAAKRVGHTQMAGAFNKFLIALYGEYPCDHKKEFKAGPSSSSFFPPGFYHLPHSRSKTSSDNSRPALTLSDFSSEFQRKAAQSAEVMAPLTRPARQSPPAPASAPALPADAQTIDDDMASLIAQSMICNIL